MLDLFFSIILTFPLFALLKPLIYAGHNPQQLLSLAATDAARKMAQSHQPSVIRYFHTIFQDERVYQYFIVEGGLWRIGLEQFLQLAFCTALYLYCWIRISATPGKMAMSLKIVDESTLKEPSKKQLFIRFFAYFVSTLPLGLGFLWIVFDKRKQGWHDKLAHTLVVKK